jgi:hypothetical protein
VGAFGRSNDSIRVLRRSADRGINLEQRDLHPGQFESI